MLVRVLGFPPVALLPVAEGKEKGNGITLLCFQRDGGGGEERGSEKLPTENKYPGALREACLEQEGRWPSTRASPRASGCPARSPETENSDDNDHQDQHHTHDGRACDQGQLLPPALILWGRKTAIRRSPWAPGIPPQPQGMSCVPLRTGPQQCGRCGEAQWFPNCFPPARAPPKSLRVREEVSQPRYSESGFDFVQL